MLPLLACLVAIQVPIEQPPRLRTILENGASVIVEKTQGAKTLSIQLFASSRGTEETPTTNGLRHLLEHLAAKGAKGDLDERLELHGAFLQAVTEREDMQFKITLPPGQLALGLMAVEQLMQMPQVTTDKIQHEAEIISQEAALRDEASKLSLAAWTQAYGDKGLDVMGNIDVIRNATPPMLDKIHRTQFSGPNLAIAVVGDVDLDATTKACAAILSRAPKATATKISQDPAMGGDVTSGAKGEAIALPTSGWRSPQTAARIAAAFAIASEADNCFVLATPSSRAGLVLVGRSTPNTGLKAVAVKADAASLFAYGRLLARAWVRGMLSSPSNIAEIRGKLIVQEFDLKPETMIENLETMTFRNFSDAIAAFRSVEAIRVEGK